MGKFRRFRPSPALVISVIALFVAIGGISWAAATIGTSDIKNGAVTNKKLHKNAVVTKKIKNNAVTGAKAKESSFSQVPEAAHADNATNAQNAANAEALSGNTVVGEGDIDGPGFVTNSSCTPISKTVPGAQAGDHVVLTPPSGWPTYEINLTARVTADTVTYEICNESGTNQNFGTSPPLRFLVFR
jgi:hypothetical protein